MKTKKIKKLKKFKKSKKRKYLEQKEREVHKDIRDMSKQEKKRFLSMDLIERMIRVEQRVAASFNKELAYNQTDYYKSLTSDEKKRFEDHLKKGKRKKALFILIIALPLLILFALRNNFTGRAVENVIEDTISIGLLERLLAIIVLTACLLFLLMFVFKKKRNRRFEKDFKIIDEAFLKKHTVRHLN